MNADVSGLGGQQNLPSAVIILDIATIVQYWMDVVGNTYATLQVWAEVLVGWPLQKFGERWLRVIEWMHNISIKNTISGLGKTLLQPHRRFPAGTIRFRTFMHGADIIVIFQPYPTSHRIRPAMS